jgi:thioredoxin-dependent peroxiredoxin
MEVFMTLKEGDIAPDFNTRDAQGNPVKLSDFRGQKVVLYFYCSLRDSYKTFEDQNIKILGVSLDDETSHQAFASKYNLPFTLLADTDHSVSDAYGVYGEKQNFGKTYMGISRTTFLIDEEGKIKKVFNKVNVDEHADEVLKGFNAEGGHATA